MKVKLIVWLALLCIMNWAQAQAEKIAAPPQTGIVKLRAFIPSDARTAKSLGTEREGTGVLIDADGHILTIGYLILEAEAIEVIGPDGQSIVATYVGYDHTTGFGMVKIDKAPGLHPLELGQSSKLTAGDQILMIGHGGAVAMRKASVIAREEFVGYWEYLLENAIYVAPPHPQHSGVAMVNDEGRLVGIGSILTQMVTPQLGLMACNMFVPIDLVKPILGDLIQQGRTAKPPKPWIGVYASEARGRIFVDRVHGAGPAAEAGLLENDILLEVNRKPVASLADFYRSVWALGDAGVEVPVTILRGSRIKEVVVRSANRYKYLRIRPTLKAPPSITEKAI